MNAAAVETAPWKILIVDDEPEIHILTRTVLKDVEFEDKPLEFLSAYDASQTRNIMSENDDIALILMDVIMEEDNTGLELIRYIRENMKNHLTRIILRTGHPGEAPERRIIIEYEINDYKEKVDLTSNRLFTSVIKSLRNYRDLTELRKIHTDLEESSRLLARAVESSTALFEMRTLEDFMNELFHQVTKNMTLTDSTMLIDPNTGKIIRAIGTRINLEGTFADEDIQSLYLNERNLVSLPGDSESRIRIGEGRILCRFDSVRKKGPVLISEISKVPGEKSLQMLELFIGNAIIVYNNIILEKDSQETQTDIIDLLGSVVEERDYEDGEIVKHVNRVSEFVIYMARKLEYSEEDIAILRNAVPLHDIGKIGIFDEVLMKPGRLTDEEYTIMKEHAAFGYEILRTSSYKLFRIASIIAWQHHERWDGNGYPQGLAGEDIHELGRLTCIADVFDALSSDRIYRKAWSFEKTMEFIRDGKGTQFDPKLTDLFLEDPGAIRDIVDRQKEKY